MPAVIGQYKAARRVAIGVSALLVALRFIDLNWDDGIGFHPDERALAYAAERLSLDPLELDPQFFAYGSLPIYLNAATASLIEPLTGPGIAGITLTGRLLSALAGSLTLLLLWSVVRRRSNERAAWMATVFLGGCALHIQNSRFFTVDVLLTLITLAALAALFRAEESGRLRHFGWAGAFVGLALATKASASMLLVPVALAALRARRPVAGTAVAAVSALACFALAEPFAFLDFTSVRDALMEQSRIVRIAGAVPYTVQYVGAPRYAYELQQMLLWTLGPPFALCAAMALGARITRAIRAPRVSLSIETAWVLACFASFGWLEIKFPRYLLPLYPVLAFWAGTWLEEQTRRGRAWRAIGFGLLAAHVLLALAFAETTSGAHTVVRASNWTYAELPEGSTILRPHWDEGFPVRTARGAPDRYTVRELPLYEADTPEKLDRIALELGAADALAFPTRRTYGAIPRARERYPGTTRFLEALFGGDLGYTLARGESSRPRLFGIELSDDLGDESLSVYDHPRVLVFVNEMHLPPEAIRARLLDDGTPGSPSRRDMLTAEAASEGRAGGSLAALIHFSVLIEVLGLAAWILLASARMPAAVPAPAVFVLAKVVGPLGFAWVAWLASSVGLARFDQTTLVIALAVFLLAAGWRMLHWSDWRRVVAAARPARGEALFWSTFFAFLGLRMLDPAIHWGEKPMDFSILAALARTDSLPPPDPWIAGEPLRYSYFGQFWIAAIAKLGNVAPRYGFNLGVAFAAACTGSAAFAAAFALARRWRAAWLGFVLVLLAGNLAGPLEFWRHGALDFGYFWATSRVIPGTINEYPLWSFLFADLHAHVLVMPLSLAFVGLLPGAFGLRGGWRSRFAQPLLLGWLLGTIAMANTWSVPVHIGVLLVVAIGEAIGRSRRGAPPPARSLLELGITLATAIAASAPFWFARGRMAMRVGWVEGESVHPLAYAMILGLFLVILLPVIRRELQRSGASRRGAIAAEIAFACLVGAAVAGARTLSPALLLLALAAGRAAVGARPSRRMPLLLCGCAFGITALPDLVFVWDRMNTVFKWYLEAWLLLALASAVLFDAMRRARGRAKYSGAGLALCGAMAVVTAFSVIVARAGFERVENGPLSLDGLAYLDHSSPDEAAAIEWLERSVGGLPVVAEAWGPEYRGFSRVASLTGIPSVVGWAYHLTQRGWSMDEISERQANVDAIFTARSSEDLRRELERSEVDYVFVGALERSTYPGLSPDRWRSWNEVVTPVFESGEVVVFRVARLREPPGHVPRAGAPHFEALRQPRSISVSAADGRGLVADFGRDRIVVLSPDLEPVASLGRSGSGAGELREPCDAAWGPGGLVYVADTWNHRVQVLDEGGRSRSVLTADFFAPRGLALGPDGNLYVADTGNHRVVVLSRDGGLIASWSGSGSHPLREPTCVVADGAAVWVCDVGNERLVRFDREGRITSAISVPGWRRAAFSEPKAALSGAEIWVTVPLEGTIRAYAKTGELRFEADAGSTVRGRRVELSRPLGLSLRPARGDAVVVDADRGLVRVPTGRGRPAERSALGAAKHEDERQEPEHHEHR